MEVPSIRVFDKPKTMAEEKTIDQKSNLWNNRMALSFGVSIILGTNIFNSYVSDIAHNKSENLRIEKETKEDLAELEAQGRRRVANAVKELNYQITIKDLTKELKEANKNN